MRHLVAGHETNQSGLLRDGVPEGRVKDVEDQHGEGSHRLPARIRCCDCKCSENRRGLPCSGTYVCGVSIEILV